MTAPATFWVCLLIAVGFAHSAPPITGIAAVRKLDEKYRAALLSNNIDDVLSLYDDNVIMMPDGYPAFKGKQALAPSLSWVNAVASVRGEIGGIAYLDKEHRLILQRKTSTVIDKDGNTMFDGKTLLIWIKTSDGYKISLEMYNDNS